MPTLKSTVNQTSLPLALTTEGELIISPARTLSNNVSPIIEGGWQ